MEFIQLKEVSKSFGRKTIIQDVNLTIKDGEIWGVLGNSGSGKTTLLNLLSGFLQPSVGEIGYFSRIDNQPKNLYTNFHKIKRHIGFTPQHSAIYPKLTVKENLLHFGQLYGLKKETIIENAKSLLHFTGLYEDRDKIADHLSEGMRKRLDIMCSLIHKPRILFLDEPTANLGPIAERDVLALIEAVNAQGVTVVMASHNLENVERVCTKFAIIKDGKLRSYQMLDELQRPFLKDNVSINIKTSKEKDQLIAIAKKLPVSRIVDQGNQLVLDSVDPGKTMSKLLDSIESEGLYLHDLDVRKPTLREIFEKIVEDKE